MLQFYTLTISLCPPSCSECGNQAMANETITKIDTTNPTVVPPANVNYQCGTDFPTNLEPATGADTCSSVDISFADSAVVSTPSCENGILETTTRTWTATEYVPCLRLTCAASIH